MGDEKCENKSSVGRKEDCRDGNRSWAMGRQDGEQGSLAKASEQKCQDEEHCCILGSTLLSMLEGCFGSSFAYLQQKT
jgi:hypothetical protein